MATVLPPPSKRQKRAHLTRTTRQQLINPPVGQELLGSFKARFVDSEGNQLTDVIEIPIADAIEKNVSLLLNTLLGRDKDQFLPYRFRLRFQSRTKDGTKEDGEAVSVSMTTIETFPAPIEFLKVLKDNGISNPFETTITLAADPQAVFRVRAVTRMSARISGHSEAILCVSFSPVSSSRLATGSGDRTARIWDTDTGTPKLTLSGHSSWVLAVAWSPDGSMLATGSMDKSVKIWDPETGKEITVKGGTSHSKWVTSLAWEPYHMWSPGIGARLASASKDCTIRIFVVNTGRTEFVLSGHRSCVSNVKWGGLGWIYSASHDKTIRVWDAEKGTMVHTLTSHAHWVNHLALSTDFVLRTGYIDPYVPGEVPDTEEKRRQRARERFEKAARVQGESRERLISASDDCTMFLWDPKGPSGTKPLERMMGHQNTVNSCLFSPDGTRIASAGFDNHVKLWDGWDGTFIGTLRGHVGSVYACSFSADSRLLVSASKDNTLKIWSMEKTGKLTVDLPGHQDEVYAVDWSPDGQKVGSGGRDKAVRVWRN